MSAKVKIPQYENGESMEKYKQELLLWAKVTDVPAKKQAIVIALNMPKGDESGIREKILEQMPESDLEDDKGLEKLIKFMEEHFGKDELASCLEKYEDFDDYKREKNQVVADFILGFQHLLYIAYVHA